MLIISSILAQTVPFKKHACLVLIADSVRPDKRMGTKSLRENPELMLNRDGNGLRTTDSVTLWLQCPTSTLHRYHNFNMNPMDPAMHLREGLLHLKVRSMKQCTPLVVLTV